MCGNGLLCFVPVDVAEGDIICRIQSSSILVVIREDANRSQILVERMLSGKLIGRAIDILPESASRSGDTRPSVIHYNENACTDVRIQLDAPTLQLLTVASSRC
jgi:hypothetical protein